MRRSGLIPAIMLLAAAGTVTAQVSPDVAAEEQAILRRGEQMLAAENARDLNTSIMYYAEDAVISAPNRPVVIGREAIRAMYERFQAVAPPMKGEYVDRTITVAKGGDLAWEHGGSRTTITAPSGTVVEEGKQLIVWKKVAGVWVVAAMSWSSNTPIRQPPAARD